jgi:hypothetical protein
MSALFPIHPLIGASFSEVSPHKVHYGIFWWQLDMNSVKEINFIDRSIWGQSLMTMTS